MQTVFPSEKKAGDCLRACLASVLDMRPDAVPHYMDRPDWRERLSSWLEEEKGLALVEIDLTADNVPIYPITSRVYCIVAGTTSRHPDRLHAVVAQTYGAGLQWRYVHDPHPTREFIKKAERLYLLAVTDPRERR
jgi:hypothetical protein